MYVDRFEPIGPEPADRCQLFFFNINADDGKWLQVGSLAPADHNDISLRGNLLRLF